MNVTCDLKKYKLNKSVLTLIVLIIPFFRLLSFSYFIEHGYHFFVIVELIYNFLRVISASLIYIWLHIELKEKKYKISRLALFFVLFFIFRTIACGINGSINFLYIIKVYTYIAFIFLCDIETSKENNNFLRANRLLFGLLSIIGLVSIYMFPHGLLSGRNVYEAVYFLGSKNASFPFYYTFLLCIFLDLLKNNTHHEKIRVGMLLLITLGAAIICESVSSFLCLLLMASLFFMFYSKIKLVLKPSLIFVPLIVILIIIYVGAEIMLITDFLGLVGRNPTFSSRTIIWAQAFYAFQSHMFFGAGDNLIFQVGYRITDHAHSIYIDMLAKYGLIPFIVFIVLIYKAVEIIKRNNIESFATIKYLLLAIYLLHSGFDDYNIHFLILIIMLISKNAFIRQKEAYK